MNDGLVFVALIILSGLLICIWLLNRIRGRVEAIWAKLEGWESELQCWAGGLNNDAKPSKIAAEISRMPNVGNDADFHRD